MHPIDLARQYPTGDGKVLDEVLHAQERLGHCAPSGGSSTQATLCPCAPSSSGGAASRHLAMACGQRAAKRQPTGGRNRLGTTPPMVSSRRLLTASRSMRGMERINPRV